jgi:transglutaminase-like putative cysteine protease
MAVQTIECTSTTATGRNVRFEIHDRFRLPSLDEGAFRLDVWSPVIPETPYQRVLDIAVDAPAPWTIGREGEHGNLILHSRLTGPTVESNRFEIHYLVERAAVAHMLDPACVRRLAAPVLFAPYLQAEQYVVVDDAMRALAGTVVGEERNPILQARRIYDHVVQTMDYDAAKQSWKGSTEHALACAVGNCNDIHALFVSLCRATGIPARLILGQAFEPPPPGQEACDLCGYHCWAEFFVAGLGWVPADASCACKYGSHHLFGDLEMNHVAWSVGRDLLLAPAQRGPRLLFFAGPYAERNGEPYGGLERHISFTQVG